jgi:putative transcriptional regulator
MSAPRLPVHHPADDLLAAYAAGTASEGEALLVTCHASLCPRCARRVGELEELGGAVLQSEPPLATSHGLLARTLAKLAETPRVASPGPVSDPVLPAPLVRLIGPFDQLRWVKSLPNTWTVDFPLAHGSVPMRLRRFLPGTGIPMHGHRALELDLVLQGGVIDDRDGRSYERGDVASADADDTHSLHIAPDEECVALSVHGARVRPVGLFARLVFGYTGW